MQFESRRCARKTIEYFVDFPRLGVHVVMRTRCLREGAPTMSFHPSKKARHGEPSVTLSIEQRKYMSGFFPQHLNPEAFHAALQFFA